MIADMKLRQLVLGDERWTFENKLMGLRGVCSFWDRDLAILKEDDKIKKEKTFRKIRNLTEEINEQQYELVSVLRGGYQRIRNILASDFRAQLAYQDLPPEKIIENLEHETFVLNKRMDLLKNEKRLKLNELRNIMMEIARIRERTDLNFTSERQQFEQQRIMNLIHKESLKYNSAKTTENTLIRIIQRLERDMDYFDVVLKHLREDAEEQAKCVALTIQLGQKVAEEMGAHKLETKQIEDTIRSAMREREETVRFVRQLYRDIAVRTGQILRTDSGVSIHAESEEIDGQINILTKDLKGLEKHLNALKQVTLSNKYENILESFEKQQITKQKLISAYQKHLETRNNFEKHQMESSVLLEQNENAFDSEAYRLKDEKDRYMKLLEDISSNRKENDRLLEKDGRLHMDIIRSTRSLLELLSFIDENNPNIDNVKMNTISFVNETGETENLDFASDAIAQLKLILRKTQLLMNYISEVLSPEEVEWAKNKFVERIIENVSRQLIVDEYPDLPQVEAEEMEEQVPTRQELKNKAMKMLEYMEKNTPTI